MQIYGNYPGQPGPHDAKNGVRHNMTMLITTIFAAFMGPLTSRLLVTRASWRQKKRSAQENLPVKTGDVSQTHLWIHRCAVALMVGTLVVNVIPFNYRALGWVSLVVSGCAWALVIAIMKAINYFCQWDPFLRSKERLSLVVLTLSGLLIHSLADGAALYSFGEQAPLTWGPALFLDRIAVGFFVWSLMQDTPLPPDLETYRESLAWGSVTALCGATLLGYHMMQYVIRIVAEPQFLGVIQALLVGMVVPLMTDKIPHPTPKTPQQNPAEATPT
jgi:hypothetical protein